MITLIWPKILKGIGSTDLRSCSWTNMKLYQCQMTSDCRLTSENVSLKINEMKEILGYKNSRNNLILPVSVLCTFWKKNSKVSHPHRRLLPFHVSCCCNLLVHLSPFSTNGYKMLTSSFVAKIFFQNLPFVDTYLWSKFHVRSARKIFLNRFAWRKDNVIKRFCAKKKKLKEVQLFSTVTSILTNGIASFFVRPMTLQQCWKCFARDTGL